MITFTILDPRYTIDNLGLIPAFLSEDDPRSARAQFHENYAHGGGGFSMKGWSMGPVGEIMYPGDPAYQPIAVARLREEVIRIYPHAWASITQPDGAFEVSRMD